MWVVIFICTLCFAQKSWLEAVKFSHVIRPTPLGIKDIHWTLFLQKFRPLILREKHDPEHHEFFVLNEIDSFRSKTHASYVLGIKDFHRVLFFSFSFSQLICAKIMTQVSGIFEHNKTCYFSLESYALVFWAWKTSTVLFYFIFAKIHASYMAQKSWWDCAHPPPNIQIGVLALNPCEWVELC